MIRTLIFYVALLLSANTWADGKHLEIMAPLSQQNDFVGKPKSVVVRNYESTSGGNRKLKYIRKREYDEKGNSLLMTKANASGLQIFSESYEYDAEGTWIALVEKSEDESPTTLKIFNDFKGRRIARVNTTKKETLFLKYSENGFETGSITKSATGTITERTTVKRNTSNKEEYVLFEEPPGTKKSEFIIEWSEEGFPIKRVLILHNKGGIKFTMQYEYVKFDDKGNWLKRVERGVLSSPDGKMDRFPDKIEEREITYYE